MTEYGKPISRSGSRQVSMSIATFEPPSASSQLFFSWVDSDEAHCSKNDSVAVATKRSQLSSNPFPASNHQAKQSTGSRMAGPVRLGSVMVQLLKCYGITDDEIAEGLSAYAAKSTSASA